MAAVMVLIGFAIVSGGLGFLVGKFGPTGSRSARAATIRDNVTEWLMENSWTTSWDTDPNTAHPVKIGATIACIAGAVSVGTGFLIYRGWQTWQAAVLLVLAFLIALMMGWNVRRRAKGLDPIAYWLGRLSLWLAIGSFYVPSIVREYWPK